jgi:hypothetical protein
VSHVSSSSYETHVSSSSYDTHARLSSSCVGLAVTACGRVCVRA